MLTPRFSITQNDEFLIIEIEAPFAHVKETEVFMEDNTFAFHSSPYYLRLHFSGCIVEGDNAAARFDADRGKFVVHAPKLVHGEWFENLDMLTALLLPKGSRNVTKHIEELVDGSGPASDDEGGSQIDWFIAQEIPTEEATSEGSSYGFANKYSGVFTRLQSELSEVIDVQAPDGKSASQRSSERKSGEEQDFDDNHYLADLMEEEETLADLLLTEPKDLVSTDDLTTEQKDQLINLKPQSFKMNAEELREAGLTLVDVMFAYCYDRRTTKGEGNVESGWCIAKLSSSLSWLEKHTSLVETVVACMRRSLCYPLFRNWKLSLLVLEDTRQIFKAGRRQILKALLEVHKMLLESEPRYILNQLYIDDMCVWIQQVDEMVIASLREALQGITVEKGQLGLDLDELECAANMVLQEGMSSEKDVVDGMHRLTLDSDDSDESDESSTSSSSSDADSDADTDTDTSDAEDNVNGGLKTKS